MTQIEEGKAVALVEHVGGALAEAQPSGMETFLDNIDNVSRAAAALAKGGFYGERSPEVIGTWILQAMELGVPLGVVAKNVYKFRSSVGMMGALQLGLAVDRCGITVEHVTNTTEKYEGVMRREGWVDMKLYFDTEMAVESRLLRKKPDGTLVAASMKDGDVWDSWRRNMLMWKAINDGLRIMGADYFAIHQIRDMDTVRAMEADYVEERKHDASAELRGTLDAEEEPEDIVPFIEELREMVSLGEKAGIVEEGYRAEIMAKAEAGDTQAVKDAIESIQADIEAELHGEVDVPESDDQPALDI